MVSTAAATGDRKGVAKGVASSGNGVAAAGDVKPLHACIAK